ncbi:hypothetical protein KDA_12130 [Dictyobacter alpinus]|uniref:Uncharacterized protein n=1 Tax=Dictyobacter alpinus TaxID=2014873 RepID=A0A402B307_9CHLR|nr:hypothetical protein [Dictyobacter alpinus]GCE25729.1 hypothetical protein KDA_12130 [Dictyobacter alpinus]
MTPQMSSEEQRPHSNTYQGYEGQSEIRQNPPPYEQTRPPYAQAPGANNFVDDNFVEAVSQRIAQRLTQSDQFNGKLRQASGSQRSRASSGQRLALGIVSLGVLIPLVSVIFSNGLSSGIALIAMGMICGCICLINVIFNY